MHFDTLLFWTGMAVLFNVWLSIAPGLARLLGEVIASAWR